MARPLWTVALLGIVVLTVNLLWVAHHRPLGTFDADEAGYLTNSLAFHRSLMDGLLSGPSSPSVLDLARRYGVEMPIAEQVVAVCHQGRSAKKALGALMQRKGKSEME